MRSTTRLSRRCQRLVVLSMILALLGGCSSVERAKATLKYGMEESGEGKLIHFPPPPELPRYAYGGQLIGEINLVYEKKPEESLGAKLFRLLTGIDNAPPKPLELLRPQGVAVDAQQRVYVSDVGRGGVLVFDPSIAEVRLLNRSSGFRTFQTPVGIAIGEGGDIFVVDADVGLVARLDTLGKPKAPIGEGVLKRPTGVAYDAEQKRIIVADTDQHEILYFDLDGRLIKRFGGLGDKPGEFNRPTFLAIWRNELYVADTMNARIQVLDLDSGEPIRSIGRRGRNVGNLVRPKGIALDSEGRLYVIESMHDHLLIFDRQGQFLLPIGGTGYASGNFYLPSGVAVDHRNRVYVADMFNGRVVTYVFLGGEAEGDD